jgi:hypothetical protein
MPKKQSGRKRGGQPGNVNAYRHGYYSEHFKPDEIRDLDAYLTQGLTDEITLMRVMVKRLFQVASNAESIENQISAINAVGRASAQLAGLLRVRQILGSDDSETSDIISQALTEALESWKRD